MRVNIAYADADYGWCAYCRQFSYSAITRGGCGDCRVRWDMYPRTAPRWYASGTEADAVYVVMPVPHVVPWYEVSSPGEAFELEGLERLSLAEARKVYRAAERSRMHAHLVHAGTRSVVLIAGVRLPDPAEELANDVAEAEFAHQSAAIRASVTREGPS